MGILGILFNRQIMKYLNTDALAIYGVLTQMTVFVQCCAYSAGQAAQPIMSQNLGAQKPGRIRTCLKYGLYTSCFFGVLWMRLAMTIPNSFVRLFMTPTPSVLAMAPRIIATYGLSYLLLTFNVFITYYFQAVLKPGAATAVSLGRGVLLSGAAVMVLPALLGADALWYAMVAAEVLVGIPTVIAAVKYTKQL